MSTLLEEDARESLFDLPSFYRVRINRTCRRSVSVVNELVCKIDIFFFILLIVIRSVMKHTSIKK